MSDDEITILKLIKENKDILFGKCSSTITHEIKTKKWIDIVEKAKAVGIFKKTKWNKFCVLHWKGCGAQYQVTGDAHGLSKATVHRCVKNVCSLIVENLFQEEVARPTENIQVVPQLFMRSANFPRVAGVVDGSLIQIDAPHENEAAFVDRDGNHSINTMVVCGPNLEFYYASARWPGSVHDSRVLRCSTLCREWENGWRSFPNAIILGDSGYGLKPGLLTPNIPVEIPRTDGVVRYLRSFKSTRRIVENSLGILKEKFPCLNYLRLQPVPACNVILACITLHNIEKRLGSDFYEPYTDEYRYIEDDDDVDEPNADEELGGNPEAIQVLRSMIDRFEVY